MLKVITINILLDLKEWEQRRHLLADGLSAEKPDLIGVQEVNLEANTSAWLAEQLQMPHVHLVPYDNGEIPGIPPYGAAILSRHPFQEQATLDLQGQGRYAQRVQVEIDGQAIAFCNGHYYWYPGPSPERVQQVKRLLEWLGQLPPELPVIAVGDFNGTPDTPAIALMRERLTSAYAAANGSEPPYTCPTPLARRGWRRLWRQTWLNWKANRTLRPWRGTLDYIFVSDRWQVETCQLILTKPAERAPLRGSLRDRAIYPSDHFGLAAALTLNRAGTIDGQHMTNNK